MLTRCAFNSHISPASTSNCQVIVASGAVVHEKHLIPHPLHVEDHLTPELDRERVRHETRDDNGTEILALVSRRDSIRLMHDRRWDGLQSRHGAHDDRKSDTLWHLAIESLRTRPLDHHSGPDALSEGNRSAARIRILAARFLEAGIHLVGTRELIGWLIETRLHLLGVDVLLPELGSEGPRVLDRHTCGLETAGFEVGRRQTEQLDARLEGCQNSRVDGWGARLYMNGMLAQLFADRDARCKHR